MDTVDVKVVVADDHFDEIASVAEAVAQAGMAVGTVVRSAGAIFGTIDNANIATVRDIRGVALAVPEADYQLPPLHETVPQ